MTMVSYSGFLFRLLPVYALYVKVGMRSIAIIPVQVLAEAADKLPNPYPSQFRIDFCTNVTTNTNTANDDRVSGRLSYDWLRRVQRIDHGAGAYECLHFYGTNQPCSLIFNAAGMYRLLLSSIESSHGGKAAATTSFGKVSNNRNAVPYCCLDLPDSGAPPPNWAQTANGTFNGVVYDLLSGLTAFQWTFDRLPSSTTSKTTTNESSAASSSPSSFSLFHTAQEVALGEYSGRPLSFSFPSRDGIQDYHFDVESMLVGQPDPSIFVIPNGCESTLCDSDKIY